MTHQISVKNLSKYASDQKRDAILKDISFTITKGEFLAIMGPSGSGKSTLLYNLCGIQQADEGEVYFQDRKLSGKSEEELAAMRLQQMGFVFQQIHFLSHLSVFENIVLPGYQAKQEPRAVVDARAKELLAHMGIAELADRRIGEVSGGELQRAGLCRALINQPEIVFGDEPTGALNSQSAQLVLDLLADLPQPNTTRVLVTHDAAVASRADRVIYLADGCIVDEISLSKDTENRDQAVKTWLGKLGY